MGKIIIELDPETEKYIRKMVEESGLSQSEFLTQLIREKAAALWPKSIRDLAGAWDDLPLAEEIRKDYASDASRESF